MVGISRASSPDRKRAFIPGKRLETLIVYSPISSVQCYKWFNNVTGEGFPRFLKRLRSGSNLADTLHGGGCLTILYEIVKINNKLGREGTRWSRKNPASKIANSIGRPASGFSTATSGAEDFPTEAQYITEKDAEHDARVIGEYLGAFGLDVLLYPGDPQLPERLRQDRPETLLNLVDSVNGKENLAAAHPGCARTARNPLHWRRHARDGA